MEYVFLNPIKIEGSRFEKGYGYSKFIKLKINNKLSSPVLSLSMNTWGAKDNKDRTKKKIFERIKEEKDCLSIYGESKGLEFAHWVGGMPTIRLGEGIWEPKTRLKLGQIKDYKDIKISTNWGFEAKGWGNLTFDIWLTKDEEGITKNHLEIMVFLDCTSKKAPWKEIGTFGPFNVGYLKKGSDWEGDSTKGGETIAFVLNKSTNQFKFNFMDLVKYCEKYINKKLGNYWLRSIDLGTEFAANSKVEAKIFKLDFDFKK